MATYVMSDIHGCYDEFVSMLDKIRLSEGDELILAGDYVDRGRQNLEMLRWIEEPPANVTMIKGNHDAKFVESVKIMDGRGDDSEGSNNAGSCSHVCINTAQSKHIKDNRKNKR